MTATRVRHVSIRFYFKKMSRLTDNTFDFLAGVLLLTLLVCFSESCISFVAGKVSAASFSTSTVMFAILIPS